VGDRRARRGLCCATLFTFFRDVRPVVQIALMFAFFTAPILFNPDLFPPGSTQARLLAWHPLTYLAALFQKPIYAGQWPGPLDWAVSSAAVAALAVGIASLRWTRPRLYTTCEAIDRERPRIRPRGRERQLPQERGRSPQPEILAQLVAARTAARGARRSPTCR
jgi:hypothetical protein